jgi:hypothetical protein
MNPWIFLAILLLIIPAQATLAEDAWQIHNEPLEHAFVYVNGVTIYKTTGDNNSFWIFNIAILDNATLLHNHPVNEGPSKKDMDLAIRANVYKMVISTHNGVWTLIRPFDSYTFTPWPR